MSLNIGIVGLPNVGKSTIFNALTKSKTAQSANYPFCTIEPNVGVVEVPDFRLKKLAEVSKSEKIIPAIIKFVDIAGLVKGASTGEGLGNKFLAHIRECDAIAHVIRAFDDPNVTHVHGKIDPSNDMEIIESELLIADMQTVEKRLAKAQADSKSGEKDKKEYKDLLERLFEKLKEGLSPLNAGFTDKEIEKFYDLHLITMKPNLYILNLPEHEIKGVEIDEYMKKMKIKERSQIIPISAKVEEELIGFSEEEAKTYLQEMGLKMRGLDLLIISAYELLGLITYFTSGTMETRAWTIKKGTLAPQAAGVIHTDFEKGFIKAEVIDWEDLVSSGGEIKAKEKGLMRLEGKDYIVRDGDVMHFKFSS